MTIILESHEYTAGAAALRRTVRQILNRHIRAAEATGQHATAAVLKAVERDVNAVDVDTAPAPVAH